MFNTKETEVVVIGAGPVGMISALVLNRLGLDVMIIDGAQRVATRSNATLLHPSTLELLQSWGLYERIMGSAFKIENIEIYHSDQENLNLKLSQLESPFPFIASLPQTTLEIILERELEREGIPIFWNYKAIDCFESTTGVEIKTQHYSDQSIGYAVSRMERMIDKSMRIRAQFAIAADGTKSLIRKRIGLQRLQSTPPQYFIMFDIKSSSASKKVMRLNVQQDLVSSQFPITPNVNRLMFQFKGMNLPEDFRVKSRDPLQEFFEPIHLLEESNLRSLISSSIPWDAGDIERILWRVAVPFEQRIAKEVMTPKVLLLGDAARTFEPISAASLNLGISEATKSCSIIADTLNTNSRYAQLTTLSESFYHQWQMRHHAGKYTTTMPQTKDWIAQNRDRILPCIPASGNEFVQIAKQLSIHAKDLTPVVIPEANTPNFTQTTTTTTTLKREHNHVT